MYDERTLVSALAKHDPKPGTVFPEFAGDGPTIVVWLNFGSPSAAFYERTRRDFGDAARLVILAHDSDQLATPTQLGLRTVLGSPELARRLNGYFGPRWYRFDGGRLTRMQRFGMDAQASVREALR